MGYQGAVEAGGGIDFGQAVDHFGGGQGASDGGVHVTHYHHHVGAILHDDLLVGDHHPTCLLSMAAATCAQVDMGLRQFQVLKKGIRHVEVVVLSCMYDLRLQPRLLAERMVKRSDLHEIGACGGDQVDGAGHGEALAVSLLLFSEIRMADCRPILE